MYTRVNSWKCDFRNPLIKNMFYSYVLHNVRRNECCKFRCFNVENLTAEDVEDMEAALKEELGREYVVEPKRKLVHIRPKSGVCMIHEPDNYFGDDGVWHSLYDSEEDFWECNGI